MTYRWLALVATAALALFACSAGSGPGTAPPSASAPGLTTPAPVSSSASQQPSVAPIASAGTSASTAASPAPLGRDQAIAIARRFGLGVGMTGIVQTEAGPLRQFDPDPNPKIAPPPPDQWVWRVRLVGPISTSFVILDYYTGQYIEAGIATPWPVAADIGCGAG